MLAQRAADPRRRGAARAARAASASRSTGRGDNERPPAAPTRSPSTDGRRGARRAGSAPRSCSPARCSPASARRGCRRPAATHRPPPPRPPPRRLPRPRREGRRRPRWIEISAPPERPAGRARIFMDEPSVMGDRERADGRGADRRADDDRQRRLASRTSRTSRACSVKMGAQIDGIGSNVMTVHGRDKLGGAEHDDLPRPHRGRQLHGARRRDRRRAADPRRRARRPDA